MSTRREQHHYVGIERFADCTLIYLKFLIRFYYIDYPVYEAYSICIVHPMALHRFACGKWLLRNVPHLKRLKLKFDTLNVEDSFFEGVVKQ